MEGATIFIIAIIALICIVLDVVGLWKVFAKANKPGWHAIIPVLNAYDLYDICWKGYFGLIAAVGSAVSGFLTSSAQDGSTTALTVIGGAISLACTVISIVGMFKLSKSFGRGIGTALGLIFLSPIFMLILGFGKAEYIGKAK